MNNKRARMSLAAVVVAAAVSLSGCSIIDQFLPSSQPVRDAETGEVTEQVDNADVFAIRVGDCLNTADMDTTEEVSDVPVVPCDEPHDDEVYATFTLDHGEYPGEAAAETLANDGCRARFADFIGIADEDSVFEFFPMYPSPEGWNAHGDRTVRCIVWYPADTVVGSLSGAGY